MQKCVTVRKNEKLQDHNEWDKMGDEHEKVERDSSVRSFKYLCKEFGQGGETSSTLWVKLQPGFADYSRQQPKSKKFPALTQEHLTYFLLEKTNKQTKKFQSVGSDRQR